MMKKVILILISAAAVSCSGSKMRERNEPLPEVVQISSNENGTGQVIEVELVPGKSFYYPLFAIWLEDSKGHYIQTLYVARSVATGVFKYGSIENGKWLESVKRAPQTLPYWAHKRAVKASDGLYMPEPANPVPDAYTGATPVTGFILSSRADKKLPDEFRVMLEINQNWDWNEYWTNDKYPDDKNYMMSCQPAVVYAADVNLKSVNSEYLMKPVGHSHYSGQNGDLYTDLSTLTTALQIADEIKVRIKQ